MGIVVIVVGVCLLAAGLLFYFVCYLVVLWLFVLMLWFAFVGLCCRPCWHYFGFVVFGCLLFGCCVYLLLVGVGLLLICFMLRGLIFLSLWVLFICSGWVSLRTTLWCCLVWCLGCGLWVVSWFGV